MLDKNGDPVYDENGDPVIINNAEIYSNMDKEEVWRTKLLTRSGCREPFLQGRYLQLVRVQQLGFGF